jgi:hypothetical protein
MSVQTIENFQTLKICKKKNHLSSSESYLILIRKPFSDHGGSYFYLYKYYFFLNKKEKLVVEVYTNFHYTKRKLRSNFHDITHSCPFAFDLTFECFKSLLEKYKDLEEVIKSLESAIISWDDWHR